MTQQTIFEQFLDALLDEGGHEVHFKKKNGTISMTLDNQKMAIVVGVTLEQIGQLGIGSAICIAFKKNTDQGGAGKTRIDGAVEACKDEWHDSPGRTPKCPSCREEYVEDLVVE